MINGRNISASSKELATAKQKFIDKLVNPQNDRLRAKNKKSDLLLESYLIKWLEATRKPYVKENTYKSYLQTVNVDILPKFGNKKITEISTFDIQEHMNQYYENGKFITAHKTYQILNAMFNFAVADNKIQRSPTLKVILGTYEQEHGTALTRAEEKELLNKFYEAPHLRYRQAFIFIIYTGLRRSELASVEIDEKWVSVTSAKQRKGKKEKTRRIPISPMLKRVLPMIDIALIKKTEINKLTNAFKEICPGHHLHDLRHTFITRCQECYISREMVSIWAGHSTDRSITSTVYTHLEQYEERQLEEIKKFDYEL